jgi:predicted nucleic acid-binding protein
MIPDAVLAELRHPAAPSAVRSWAAQLPSWAQIEPVSGLDDAALGSLGAGERAAITLALAKRADLILIDERRGTQVALGKGFEVSGTLGILNLASRRGLIRLDDAFARLKRTNFRFRQKLMDELLDLDKQWRAQS